MTGATLDSGALIAFERGERKVAAIVAGALDHNDRLAVPAGVVGQVWRNGRRQSVLARLLSSEIVELVALDGMQARAAGQLCGVSGTADVIDASVVVCARARSHRIVTGDPHDLRALDPRIPLVVV